MARILVVEDDPDTLFLWEHALSDTGHVVDAIDTVEGGCELLAGREYDLVLTDGRLHDGVGIAVADKARERGVPALIVTAYAFILHELADDPDRYDVLLKPLRPSELVDAVSRKLFSPSHELGGPAPRLKK